MTVKTWKWNDMMNKVYNYGGLCDHFVNVDVEVYYNIDGKAVEADTVSLDRIRVEILKETEKAVQLRLQDVWTEWFPKSTIVDWR